MSEPIRATLLIDPGALSGNRANPDPQIFERVEALLTRVSDRLAHNNRVLVDGAEAERLTGLNEKTLRNHGCPHVKVGARRMYRPAAIDEWAREREAAAAG